jgi:hypothetical protein
MHKGIGPNRLGSPLKQAGKPGDKIYKGGMLDKATVTAKKPKSPPSLETKLQYGLATGQLKMLEAGKPKPIMGTPPMVGGGKIAAKGFQLAKKAVSSLNKYGQRTANATGEALEAKEYLRRHVTRLTQ